MITIGIVGHSMGESAFGVSKEYIAYFQQFGMVIVFAPMQAYIPVNLLVLAGGPDVSPTRYDQVPSVWTHKSCPIREHFTKNYLGQYIESGVKIVGICRGFQDLCVFFGAELIQHENYKTSRNNFELVDKLMDGKVILEEINSRHHQGVNPADVPDGFEILGISANEGNVEAISHKDLPIVAVQYHPESIGDQFFYNLVTNLIKNE